MIPARRRGEFRVPSGYLDTATAGIPPLVTVEVLQDAVVAWGAGGIPPGSIDQAADSARRGFAQLIGVPSQTVCIGPSVSALLGLVASQVPAGARVLTVEREYSSVTMPFAAQGGRRVSVDAVGREEVVERASDYDVVAFSVVQPADGGVIDADAIRRATAGTDTLVLIDVTQAAGWQQLHLGWADAVVGGGYKWLLGPRGIAWMALRPEFAEMLVPTFANWRATAGGSANIYASAPDPMPGARRFDSSPIWATLLPAAQSLHWLGQRDLTVVRAHCLGLASTVRDRLDLERAESPIVSVPTELTAAELRDRGIAAAVRDGCARLAFHLYNDADDVELCLAAFDGRSASRGARA